MCAMGMQVRLWLRDLLQRSGSGFCQAAACQQDLQDSTCRVQQWYSSLRFYTINVKGGDEEEA